MQGSVRMLHVRQAARNVVLSTILFFRRTGAGTVAREGLEPHGPDKCGDSAMADAAQRQRKLAAKAARRKAAVAERKKTEGSSASLAGRVRMAAKGPIVHCLMPTNLFEAGIGTVLVARRLPSGMLGCAWFLVDVFCLGVKDIFYREVSEAELRSRLGALSETQEFVEVEPSRARRLIRDAAAYAAGLGLPAAKQPVDKIGGCAQHRKTLGRKAPT